MLSTSPSVKSTSAAPSGTCAVATRPSGREPSGPSPVVARWWAPSGPTTSGAGCPRVAYSSSPVCGSSSATQTVAANAPATLPANASTASSASRIPAPSSSRAASTARSWAMIADASTPWPTTSPTVRDIRPSGRVAESNQSPPAACSTPATR